MSFIISSYQFAGGGASNGLLTGLQSYWKLDEASGASTFVDAHGGNDGTNNGATAGATGIINNAVDFDGASDYVGMGDVLDFDRTDTLSVSAWINRSSSGSAHTVVCKQGSSADGFIGWAVRVRSDNYIEFTMRSSSVDMVRVRSNTTISTSTWYHVCFTYDGTGNSGVTCYINGSAVADTDLTATFSGTSSNTKPFNIGSRDNGDGGVFDGLIDEVGVWNIELTSGNVTDIYNSGSGLAYSSFTS